ncbi:hypothetical protein D3C81_1709420 [compost metagenome]
MLLSFKGIDHRIPHKLHFGIIKSLIFGDFIAIHFTMIMHNRDDHFIGKFRQEHPFLNSCVPASDHHYRFARVRCRITGRTEGDSFIV